MNEQDIRELLKLIRGIEHFLERCLKTITEKQLKQQGIEITTEKELPLVDYRQPTTEFEF